MKLDLVVQNFGKIKRADIKLRPFTVIVGPNSSGKSFLTKGLYSIFHTMNKDLSVDFLIKTIHSSLHLLTEIDSGLIRTSQQDSLIIVRLNSLFEQLLNEILISSPNIDVINNSLLIDLIKSKILLIRQSYNELTVSLKKGKATKYHSVESSMLSLEERMFSIEELINYYDSKYVSEFSEQLKSEFMGNFQVSSLRALHNENLESSFDSPNFGKITLSGNEIGFDLNREEIARLQNLYNVVYLESPIYFKMRSALKNVQINSVLLRRKGAVNQVPKYFYDLDELLEQNFRVDNDDFSDVLEKIESSIDGKIELDNGRIVFKDNSSLGLSIPLHMVSSGISNLGIISLMIKNNILSKGSYLFIDEPEVNLHTEWQHLMLDVLVQLSKKGVMVVIATHSLDMIYRLEYLVSLESEDKREEHFSLNRLTKDGYSEEHHNLLVDIRKAKQDLGKPYINLMNERLP